MMEASPCKCDRKRRRVWEKAQSMDHETTLSTVRVQDSSLFRVGIPNRWRAFKKSSHQKSNQRQWCSFLFLCVLINTLEYTEGAWSRWLHPHDEYIADKTTGTTTASTSNTASTTPEKVKIQLIPPILQDGVEVEASEETGSVPTIVYIFATWPPAPHAFTPIARPPNVTPPSRSPVTPSPVASTTNQPISQPSPEPTMLPVRLPPATTIPIAATLEPTNSPSLRPTKIPTNAPTSTEPTSVPSKVPLTVSPTSMEPATIMPTTSPTNRPSVAPMTRLPVATPLLPPPTTGTPITSPPTTIPTKFPTRETTIPPTKEPIKTTTIAPTNSPTPTRQLMAKAQVSVPFTFPITVDTVDQEQVLIIWQNYLTNLLIEEFGSEPGISVETVKLVSNHSTSNRRRRRRSLAPENLVITGNADFVIDETVVEWREFSNRVQMVLNEATTVENLQEALTNAGNPAVLTSPTMAPVNEDEQMNQRTPNNAEIVIGFAILILTMISLLYWAVILWKRRETRKRREQLEALRQQSLRNATNMGRTAVAPLPKLPIQLQRLTSDEPNDDLPVMPNNLIPFPPAAITDGESTQSSDEQPPSDPFALELQKAVSLDRRAWEEYRMQKEQESVALRNTKIYDHSSEGVEVATPSVNTSSVTSFPYGDEEERGASPALGSPYSPLPPIREATNHRSIERVQARRYQAPDATITKKTTPEEYSPYGDRPAIAGDRRERHSEYWDRHADKIFHEDVVKQAQYSFLHPLRPRDVEADIPNAEDSSNSEETPTTGAVRESIEVTSIDDIQELESKENDPNEPTDEGKDWPTSLTETMLREVEYISQFVRRYEQKRSKKATRKSRPGELYDDSGEAVDEATLDRVVTRSVNRNALQPVSNSSLLEEGRGQGNQVPRVEPSMPSRIMDEEYRGRLGIGKFTIGRPVTNRSTQFDNKPSRAVQFRDAISEVSPIHSEEDLSPQRQLATPEPAQNPGRLSALRNNDSILDITPVGEFAVDTGSVSPRQVSNDSTPPATSAYSARKQRRQDFIEKAAGAAEPHSRKKKVSPRSNNMTFNNIRSIFESKETDPIVPPNENVRNTGRSTLSHAALFIFSGNTLERIQ